MLPSLTLRRWAWIVALSAVAAACFELFLGFAWTYGRRVPIPDAVPSWALWVLTIAVVIALFWNLLEPLSIGARQLRFVLRYPPIWLAVVFGFMLVAGRRGFDPDVLRPAVWVEIPLSALLITALALLVAWVLTHVDQPPQQRFLPPIANLAPTADPQALAEWANAERPSEVDLFDHRRIARRLARILREPIRADQSIALVGECGVRKDNYFALGRS